MGLLQNYTVLNAEPLKYMGGAAGQCIDRAHHNRPECFNNQKIGLGSFSQKSGNPDGYAPPYQFVMPMKDGGMSSINAIQGATTLVAPMLSVTSARSNIAGSGTITQASTSLSILIQFVIDLIGGGEITAASTTLSGAVWLESKAGVDGPFGFGEVTNTTVLNIIAWLAMNLSGQGTLDGSTLKGFADMAADITSAGELVTPESCAIAVWNRLLSSHVTAGTAGKILSDIHEIEIGRWQIDADQLILYKSDNVTEIARFNLFDSVGSPTMTDVVDRQKV